jgi:hypothetical protein
MGFDIQGMEPSSDTGKYFRCSGWYWRPLHILICLLCEDFLTIEEGREMGFNEGFSYSAEKARAIAFRLAFVASDDERLARYEARVAEILPANYEGCWSKDTIIEFVEFLRDCGGFEVF